MRIRLEVIAHLYPSDEERADPKLISRSTIADAIGAQAKDSIVQLPADCEGRRVENGVLVSVTVPLETGIAAGDAPAIVTRRTFEV